MDKQLVEKYMKNLDISELEAIALVEWDKSESEKPDETEKAKRIEYIQQNGAIGVKGKNKRDKEEQIITKLTEKLQELKAVEPFNDWFKSKDLSVHVSDFLGARQIASRLKKLEKDGYLISKETKPKTYKLKF